MPKVFAKTRVSTAAIIYAKNPRKDLLLFFLRVAEYKPIGSFFDKTGLPKVQDEAEMNGKEGGW